ncbi:hypothetical protein C4D60_Mb10t02670 [Musa balbisiana]|uniref:Rho GDP-dissociation inhibitor 1 n=1 Tax=Musa balbisiana TaxID=52838 RepID=A0A4S8IU98_MUSBA|nr:hypothetical protein C4D60_Mb10t02670 [Musa balbisiana]
MDRDEQKGEGAIGDADRKLSCTSDVNEEEHGSDNEDGEEKRAVALGPQIALKEQLEMDKVCALLRCGYMKDMCDCSVLDLIGDVVVSQDDESLRKWKEQLLGNIDLTDVGEVLEPDVKIQDLTILTPDRPDLVLPIPFVPDAKGFAFALKDGSHYRLRFSFTVSDNIVSGLMYTNTVWKSGMRGTTRR